MSEKSSSANRALNFLSDENNSLLSFNQDIIADIEPSEKIESVSYKNTGFGKWEEEKKVLDNPIKKDRDQKASEVNTLEDQISTYSELSAKVDSSVLSTISQITERKTQIVSIINTAVGAGCSCVPTLTAATINGVAIGIRSDVYNDTAKIKRFNRLENLQSAPFSNTNQENLNAGNVGRGYETNYVINDENDFVQRILEIRPTGHPVFPVDLTTTCTNYYNQVQTLASEIGTLRSQLSSSLVSNANKVKSKKTEKELFLYGYRRPETYFSEREGDNNSLSQTISSTPEFFS